MLTQWLGSKPTWCDRASVEHSCLQFVPMWVHRYLKLNPSPNKTKTSWWDWHEVYSKACFLPYSTIVLDKYMVYLEWCKNRYFLIATKSGGKSCYFGMPRHRSLEKIKLSSTLDEDGWYLCHRINGIAVPSECGNIAHWASRRLISNNGSYWAGKILADYLMLHTMTNCPSDFEMLHSWRSQGFNFQD